MAEIISCPSCERKLRLPEDLLGRQVQCPTCGAAFTSGQTADSQPEPALAESAAPRRPPRLEDDDELGDDVIEEEYEVRPRRRRPRLRMDCEPERGGLVLTLGILSLLFSTLPYCMGGLGVLVAWAGIPLGITAWVMGQGDLRKMRQGVMDPRGQSNTSAGRTMGIIGVCLSAFCTVTVGAITLFAIFAHKIFP